MYVRKTGRGIDMDDMQKYLNEQLKDSKFKKEYDALESEFAVIHAILEARCENGIAQKERKTEG